MSKLILYRANWACSLIAHAVLRHLSIPFTAVLMKPGPDGYEAADGSITHAEYLLIHPSGYVPALAVDGQIITELPAILTYIVSLAPGKNLLGAGALENARVAEWMAWLSGTLHGLGYAMLRRPERFTDNANGFGGIRAKGRSVIDKCYARIDERLGGREFAVGDSLTVVDFNLYIFWQWGVEIGIAMEEMFPVYGRLMRKVEMVEGVRRAVEVEGMPLLFD